MFETEYDPGNQMSHLVCKGARVTSFRDGVMAEQMCDEINTLMVKGHTAWQQAISKTTTTAKHDFLIKCYELAFDRKYQSAGAVDRSISKGLKRARKILKTRESYNTGSRANFKGKTITDNETLIMETLDKYKGKNTVENLRKDLDGILSFHQINGCLSVMLAKGLVETETFGTGSSKSRMVTIVNTEWKKLPKATQKGKVVG